MRRIAYTGPDRQLHLIGADGRDATQLTLDLSRNPLLVWGRPELSSSAWSWPSWSPDGQRIACFELPDGDDVSRPARVHVLDTDGVRQIELVSLSGRIPIYCFWRPDGQGLAILMQSEDQLVLGYAALDQPGQLRILEEGVPLFFAWAPDGRRVLIHTGVLNQPGSSRLVMRDSQGRMPDEILPQTPGNFCTPVFVGRRLVQVERRGTVNRLLVSDEAGGGARSLLEFQGLGAVVPVPGSRRVAFSAAPAGQGSPYRGVTLVDVETGALQRLTEDDCLAFFWSEARGQLLYARVDTAENCLSWHGARVGEEPVTLCRFWPTREMLFFLHFFDQFSLSHSLLSPDGGTLVFAGHLTGGATDRASARVWVLDLATDEAPRELARGGFGCFEPSR
ncbi:MAG: PD40 domain-containing protein [Alphaproteobacteria bacterium]|nr:PD40 domain-containing protein [Alphaproteobacteria bacterium]